MEERYHPKLIEPKWQKKWEEDALFLSGNHPEKKKFYVLEMFPYPSGNLHMGHVRVYVIGDVLARYHRMKGYDVLHPMGWDALGLPAENAAIREKIHPRIRTMKNIENARRQMKMLGLSYDWSREIATCHPGYYRWNQWFFLQMYKRGIVFRRKSLANWCTGCVTVLANEQVVDGHCERCKSTVIQREIPEWAFRITGYADALLSDLEKLTDWPERIVTMQRNWIGRSEGCELVFPVQGGKVEPLHVFTTRADTVYGATYMVVAPEHPVVKTLTTEGQRKPVEDFVLRMTRVDKAVRTDVSTEKEGVWTGSYALNPYTGEQIPIWIANFVLAGYGTGAVMSVPAHDQRDFEFAKKYDLAIRVVIQPADGQPRLESASLAAAFVEDGVLCDSGPQTGKTSAQARQDIGLQAADQGKGGPTVSYHLRDWGISRQRYWGTPIPMVYCERCGVVPVSEAELPVELPPDAPITGTGEPPLAKVAEFVNTHCPACKGPAKRETDTMDTFVDSAWYFARYLDPREGSAPFLRATADRFLPVDIYVGGPEHAVAHLLYFRFWTKVMRDMGLMSSDEPVRRLITQGMVNRISYRCKQHGYRPLDGIDDPDSKQPVCAICKEPVQVQIDKMSKSKHNGVAPEAMCEQFGADAARLFSLFAAPPEKDIEWSDTDMVGCYNYLRRVWAFFHRHQGRFEVLRHLSMTVDEAQLSAELVSFHRLLHRTIDRVTRDVETRFKFNTAIAAMMELSNATKVFDNLAAPQGALAPPDPRELEALRLLGMTLRAFALMLAPFVPHFADELWSSLGQPGYASAHPWPTFDPALATEDKITIAVQVNGKLRTTLEVDRNAKADELELLAKQDEKVQKWMEGKAIRKVVVVPGRLINIVVG